MSDNEEKATITLEFDDGESLECEIVCTFIVEAYPDNEYAAVCPLDESLDDVYIFRIKEVSRKEYALVDIEDDAEFDAACEELDRLIEEAGDE
ncbi:MAG: DUF1292 domain-containing protein [Lachnospiraceae bacterium]|nr:DUF1292 domain-containing protein [Lachnospiraceae bacterium]